MSPQLLRILGLAAGITALFLSAVIVLNNKSREITVAGAKRTRIFNKKVIDTLYQFIKKLPIAGYYLQLIRQRISISAINDETELRSQALKVLATVSIAILILLIFFAINLVSWYSWLVALIVIYFMIETIIELFISRVKLRLHEQLMTFLDYLRGAYLETKMVDEALLMTIEKLDYKKYKHIIQQAELIGEVLISVDGELALENYYQRAPNSFLQIFAGLSYIVKEHGDEIVNGASSYIKSLLQLSGEVKEEIMRISKLSFGLRAMNFIALVPLITMQPLKRWASTSFYALQQFYDGPLGFIVEIVVLTIIILSIIVLRSVQRQANLVRAQDANYKYERWVNRHFKRLVGLIVPAHDSKIYHKMLLRQRKAHQFIKMEYHYIRKLSYALIFLCLTVFVLAVAYHLNKSTVLEQPTISSNFMAGQLRGNALKQAEAVTKQDNILLAKGKYQWSRQQLSDYLAAELNYSGEESRTTITRILSKQAQMNLFKPSPIVIFSVYIMTLFGWMLPEILLVVKRRTIQADIELEITRYQLIITILMYQQAITVDQILVWLERFSYYFRTPIQNAIMDYDEGASKALAELKKVSNKIAFQTLVNHLINCTESLTIAESFADFDSEKQYYQEKRHLLNLQLIDRKIFLGRVIGFVPTYALIILYFMMPLVYASTSEMQKYFDKLNV